MMESAYQDNIAEQAFKNRYIILIILLIGPFMVVLDSTIVSIALPTITSDYHITIGLSQWIILCYVITEISTILIFGKLSDYVGNSRLFMAGFAVFTVSSLACGLSTSIEELVLFRVVQAMGGSMLFSISMSILIQVFPVGEKGRVMGYFTANVALASIITPTIGGFIIDSLGWRYIFFINVPIGVALLVPALKYLRVPETRTKYKHIDYIGALILIVSMVSLLMILNDLSNPDVDFSAICVYLLICMATLAAFIARELTAKNPLLDITIFKVRDFTLPTVSMVFFYTATFILLTIQPFYFQGVMALKPSQVGLVSMIIPISMVISAPICGALTDKNGSKNYPTIGVLAMGFAFFACGYAFAIVNTALIVTMFIIFGLCRSLFQGQNSIDILDSLPGEKINAASSITSTMTNIGIMLGVSVGSILLSTQLHIMGFSGDILQAGPDLLKTIFANIMYIGGIFCLISALFSYKK